MFEPFDKILPVLKDDEWKKVRYIVSSSFSSGKLKLVMKVFFMHFNFFKSLHLPKIFKMSKYVNVCAQNFLSYLDELVENGAILDTKK